MPAELPQQKSTMRGILSKIQELLEHNGITKGDLRVETTWFLEPSSREPDSRLGRTVLRVLGCRYQPARLSPAAMTRQLEEAEDCRRCVLEQVAAMSPEGVTTVCNPEAMRSMEGPWSSSLLDASATVQVKEAQLHLVTQYHRQMLAVSTTLEGLKAEMGELSLDVLESSALQAEKLHTLLLNMEQQKGMMGELLQVGSQVSAHLSEAEGLGALFGQLGDLQGKWRLLEGAIYRGLKHASIASSQSSIVLHEAEQLRGKLEGLQKSTTLLMSSQSQHASHNMLELIFMTTDLEAFNQQYQSLQVQHGALVCSLGQKEKGDMVSTMQGLKALLDLVHIQLSTLSPGIGNPSLAKITKWMQDFIIWVKQAKSYITAEKKVALFPEEIGIQIAGIRKLQSDILARRSRVHSEMEEIKSLISDLDKEETDKVMYSLKTVEDLYETVANSSACTLEEMRIVFQGREKIQNQITNMDIWVEGALLERELYADVENVSNAGIPELQRRLQWHTVASKEAEKQVAFADALLEKSEEFASGLSPEDCRYLINRLMGLKTELDGVVARENAACWELEQLLHAQTSSAEELAAVQKSLQQIMADLERQRFPVTRESLSATEPLKHMLLEHQCQIQELQHCQETQRSALLCTIGELQEKTKTLDLHALEHEKYLSYRQRMEDSREVAMEQVKRSKDKKVSVEERFRLCQALLVELPQVKTQCQETADQLEAISQDLYPSQLTSERQKIQRTVENLDPWEIEITDDIKSLEGKLLEGLHFLTELPAMIDLFQRNRQELMEANPVEPDEKAIDIKLQRCWVIWRNLESGMRVLKALGEKERMEMFGELYTMRNAAMKECHTHMESLSQARDALKDYHCAAQGALAYIYNAEDTFLSPSGGFFDCTEEQQHTKQALASLEEGIQAHITHLLQLVPQQACLSFQQTEQLHIQVLSHLLVARATLEAQAQLRLEALERCSDRLVLDRKCHEEVRQVLKQMESTLSDCAAQEVTSLTMCTKQQDRVKALKQEVQSLTGRLETLRVGRPLSGCSVGALWRCWTVLRRAVSLFHTRLERKCAEWRDITKSMERCSGVLDQLQAELPEASMVSSTPGGLQGFSAQIQKHLVWLDEEQRTLASLEHRVAHILGLSSSQDAARPIPVCQRLGKMQDSYRELRERTMLVQAAVESEEQQRRHSQEEIREVEQHVVTLLSALEAPSRDCPLQEVKLNTASQKAKLQCIMEGVRARYAEVPPEIDRQLQEVTRSLQEVEEKVGQALERSGPLHRLTSTIGEVHTGLSGVQTLLQQQSPSVSEAKHTLKRVWDELDAWHSRLSLLEGEVQEEGEEHPEHAHLLMDQLTQPLQLYQDTAQQAEQRTTFLSRVPACLQEYEDMLHSAICWLNEAQSWLDTPCNYTTARSLQSHANTLQMVLEDSERIRATFEGFGPVLEEMSAVFDTTTLKKRLVQTDHQVTSMQQNITGPLDQLLHVTAEVDAIESEVKTMEKNVTKIRAILSSMDASDISAEEYLRNHQVILANIQSMQRTVKEMESCQAELCLPRGAEDTLTVFPRASQLRQPLRELEQLMEVKIERVAGVAPATELLGMTSQQETFEPCYSEEDEEDEEDSDEGSTHSSSSDTLTSSFPEDPDEASGYQDMAEAAAATTLDNVSVTKELGASDTLHETGSGSLKEEAWQAAEHPGRGPLNSPSLPVQSGPVTKDSMSETKKPESVTKPVTEVSLVTKQTGLVPMKIGLGTEEIKSVSETSSVIKGMSSVTTATGPVTKASMSTLETSWVTMEAGPVPLKTGVVTKETQSVPKCEDLMSAIASHGSTGHEPHQGQETSIKTQSRPDGVLSVPEDEDEDEEEGRWARLHTRLSKKLSRLREVQEEDRSGGAMAEESDGGFSAVWEIQECTSSLRRLRHRTSGVKTMARSEEDSHPSLETKLYRSLYRVVLSTDTLTDLLLNPVGTTMEDAQLRLLQLECVSAELVVLSDELSHVSSEVSPAFLDEEAEALTCLKCLKGCLATARSAFSSSQNQLRTRLGPEHQSPAWLEHQQRQVCVFEEMEQGQSDLFSHIMDVPNLEGMLGSRWRGRPEEKAELQQLSQALLHRLASLVEMGQERLVCNQGSQPGSRTQLQILLSRHKKYFQVVGSQLIFVQWLFHHKPQGVLESQEDERVRLEQQVRTLQQQALEQVITMQRTMQDWTQWEEGYVRQGRLLEELEALIPTEGPEEEESEGQLKEKLNTCQKVLVVLEENWPALGSTLDQGKALQTQVCSSGAGHKVGALDLHWRGIHSRAAQESQRWRDISDNWARFHRASASLTQWMGAAKERLRAWSSLPDTTPQHRELTRAYLRQSLDFSMEQVSRSVQKASVDRAGTLLLQLKEADAPGLRRQLSQLEQTWAQVTAQLPKAQERLHQLLLERWPPWEVMSDLEAWAGETEAWLEEEREGTHKACDTAQFTHTLQRYQERQAGLASRQLTLDFLCQSGLQAAVSDVLAHRSERTLLAEGLGALNLHWLLLQGKLSSQMRQAEELQRACTDRERRLQLLCSWTTQQTERLRAWERPVSQTQANKALLEWETVEEKLKEVCGELQELRAVRVCVDGDQERELPTDCAFTQQADAVAQTCIVLSQQVVALRPALQRVLDQWGQFEKELGEVSLHTTRLRCTLEHGRAPLLWPHQVAEWMEQLQQFQVESENGAELWAALDQSYISLKDAVNPGAVQVLTERVEGERTRCKVVLQEMAEELLKQRDLLSLWHEYSRLSEHCSLSLQHHQDQWVVLLSSPPRPQVYTQAQSDSIKNLQDSMEDLQGSVGEVLEASKPLIRQLEPLAVSLIQSETRTLSHDLLLMAQAMSGKRVQLQEEFEQQQTFSSSLESLEKHAEDLRHRLTTDIHITDTTKKALVELGNLLPALVNLTEMSCCVTLKEPEAERLQTLTRQVQAFSSTSDMDRYMQVEAQRSQSFQQKCESWTSFVDRMEDVLAVNIAGDNSGVLEQLAIQQQLQGEVMTGHQLLRGVVGDALRSLENVQTENRTDLLTNVAQLRERWRGTVSQVGERGALLQGLMAQWRLYRRGLKRLWRLLRDVDPLLPPVGLALCSLQQLQTSVGDFEHLDEVLHRSEGVYTQTLEAGRQLCGSVKDPQTQAQLGAERLALQEAWSHARGLMGKRRALVDTVIQNWGGCQAKLASSGLDLEGLKARLKQPLPETLEELKGEGKLTEENEASLKLWAGNLTELASMKTDLSQYVLAGDAFVLQGQLEELNCQWEELCQKVSLRRQEIADRLNAWTIFNEKNKELCDWLAQMENKVSRSGDLSIEDMVEKLKKDCMEEINLFSENKSHLKQLGEQLMSASDQAKQAQLHGTLQDASDRWQHLFLHIEARVKKLKETLITVQQLDKSMSNLRSWLSRVEAELSRPVTYSVCHHDEIQRRLAEQQDLQMDIEQHTEGVASVLTLCDTLLHDKDACGGDAESDSIQQTSHSLDHRWRAICALSLERRMRIEQTWRLWCKFLDDYSRFEDWLKVAERTAANPNSADVLYTVAKEELKKFECFQRQVHERLTQLELVNNQYRRLARENRTDGASKLRAMVHEGNCRWDVLHRRVGTILRRLKHFTGQREEFEGTKESLLVWLTELDLQLTNVEHFSQSDVHQKMQQLNGFQREITLNTERIDRLIVFGEGLIQRSSPRDAALIEDELEELHSYCQGVFGRVVRFHQRLTQPPTLMEEPEVFGGDTALEESCELVGQPWLGRSQGSTPTTSTHLLAPPLEHGGRETPVSVDSIPLEWDHTGDVGGSSSHEDDEDDHEEGQTYYSALSDVEVDLVTESPGAFVIATGLSLAEPSVSGRSMAIPESPGWNTPGAPEKRSLHLDVGDDIDPSPTQTSTPFKPGGYARLMSECSGSIKSVKRVSLILDDEELTEEQGLTGLTTADKQSGVIERWELLQAQARGVQPPGPQDPQQLTSDFHDITSWLEKVTPELKHLHESDTPTSVRDLEARVKQLKEMHKAFAHYKVVMLSLNLGGELRGCDSAEGQELQEGREGLEGQEGWELQDGLARMNQGWTQACAGLEEWEGSLRSTLLLCKEFHEALHSMLLWLAHAESRCYAVDIHHLDTPLSALHEHHHTLTGLLEELRSRQEQLGSLQGLWSQLHPEGGEESAEAREKLHVMGNKLRLLLGQVDQDLRTVQQRLDFAAGEGAVSASQAEGGVRGRVSTSLPPSKETPQKGPDGRPASTDKRGEQREPSPPRSFFYRVLRAAFPLHLLLLLLLVLACLVPLSENDYSCSLSNNFARSFYLKLHYTNGPPPT